MRGLGEGDVGEGSQAWSPGDQVEYNTLVKVAGKHKRRAHVWGGKWFSFLQLEGR